MVLVILSASVSVFFFILSFYYFRTESQAVIERRLMNYMDNKKPIRQQPVEEKKGDTGFSLQKLFGKKEPETLEEMLADRDSWRNSFRTELSRADIPMRPEEFIILCLGGGFLAGVVMAIFAGNVMMLPLTFIAAGIIAPLLYIRIKKQKRVTNFNSQLASALPTMANSLRVGFSLFQAMKSLSEEMSPPLATEFSRTLQEINLGTRVDDSLENLSDRVKSDDLELVVMAMIIQRQVGGNLSEVLDNIAHTIQERIKIQREIQTLTAQGKISGLVVGFMPFALALILFIINPEYMTTLFTHPLGLVMLAMAFCSQMIGVFLIRKIVNIKM